MDYLRIKSNRCPMRRITRQTIERVQPYKTDLQHQKFDALPVVTNCKSTASSCNKLYIRRYYQQFLMHIRRICPLVVKFNQYHGMGELIMLGIVPPTSGFLDPTVVKAVVLVGIIDTEEL